MMTSFFGIKGSAPNFFFRV